MPDYTSNLHQDTIPNVVCLHKLKYKTEVDGEFTLEEIRKFHHPEYVSRLSPL